MQSRAEGREFAGGFQRHSRSHSLGSVESREGRRPVRGLHGRSELCKQLARFGALEIAPYGHAMRAGSISKSLEQPCVLELEDPAIAKRKGTILKNDFKK